jgi:hypothetical protein
MNKLLANGLTYLFRGARRGQAPLSGVGAAMAIVGIVRNRRRPDRELIYARNLKDGEAVRVRLMRGSTVVDEQEVEG